MEPSPPPASQDTVSAARVEQLFTEVQKNTSLVRTDIRREAQRVIFESDAREYLYDRLRPPVHIGARGTWACNFQVLAYLVDEILRPELTNPTIVELGSGVSTAWLGLCVKEKGSRRIYSLEHDPIYHRHTHSVVEQVGVADDTQVVLAPMEDVDPAIKDLTGNAQWYGRAWLERTVTSIDVLFVDGPPSTFGPGVRAAAYPVLSSRLTDGALVVLDDVHRADEQQVVQMWTSHAHSTGAELTHVATVGESAIFWHHLATEDLDQKEREMGRTP
ncbi:class I SAM-dependent methyltransferase [Kocuria sp. U4B]